jgi:hypothetical protein
MRDKELGTRAVVFTLPTRAVSKGLGCRVNTEKALAYSMTQFVDK